MEEALERRVVGQDEAVHIVANAIRRSRAGLSDPRRPNGSFLFLVPTGVGKTELCKALAEFLFDTEEALIRMDMSEFMEKHSVARLIGAPPGYVGYEEGGYLTEAIRRRPYSVILLDEVEKAHQDVFNVLLQVLDDGRLTDGQGRTVDFRNTLIILTSNLGSDVIAGQTEGEDIEKLRPQAMEVVRAAFRPQVLNRLDDILLFRRLSRQQMTAIVDIQLKRLEKLLAERKMTIELDDKARVWLANAGYDPVYGARPLKRVIQHELQNPLAGLILEGRIRSGEKIGGTVKDGKLPINGVANTEPAARTAAQGKPPRLPKRRGGFLSGICVLVALGDERLLGEVVALAVDLGGKGEEALQVLALQLLACRQLDALRVDLAAVDQHLEMQMRAGRLAGHADIGDDLALAHAAADMEPAGEAADMAIGRGVGRVVLDADIIPIAREGADLR